MNPFFSLCWRYHSKAETTESLKTSCIRAQVHDWHVSSTWFPRILARLFLSANQHARFKTLPIFHTDAFWHLPLHKLFASSCAGLVMHAVSKPTSVCHAWISWSYCICNLSAAHRRTPLHNANTHSPVEFRTCDLLIHACIHVRISICNHSFMNMHPTDAYAQTYAFITIHTQIQGTKNRCLNTGT